MDIENYSIHLNNILSQDDGCVVLINGAWGAGKTFFWDYFRKAHLEGKATAYVSLFGKANINEIKSEALMQIFSRNKAIAFVSKITEKLNAAVSMGDKTTGGFNFGVAGNAIGLLLSLAEAKDLKESYICIDDFERKSSELGIKEIMGYASILSERYACKVIIIMNENEVMKTTDKNEYQKYKEKMVDYEIKFSPNQYNTIENMLSPLCDEYKSGVLKAIDFAEITNLRMAKKIMNLISILEKTNNGKIKKCFYNEISYRLTLLMVIYYDFGDNGLEKLTDITVKRMRKLVKDSMQGNHEDDGLDESELKEYHEKIQLEVSMDNQLDMLLWEFISADIAKIEELSSALESKEKSTKLLQIKEFIFDTINKYTYDVSYGNNTFETEICGVLNENKDQLLNILDLNQFLYVISLLKEISGNSSVIETMKKDVLHSYAKEELSKVKNFIDLDKIKSNSIVPDICKIDTTIASMLEEVYEQLKNNLNIFENTRNLLEKLYKEEASSSSYALELDSLTVQFIIQGIVECPGFLESVVKFLRWRRNFLDNRPFHIVCEKFTEAIEKLSKEDTTTFRYRRILKIIGSH